MKIEEIQGNVDDFCSIPCNFATCLVLGQVLDELKERIEDKIDGSNPANLLLKYGYNVEYGGWYPVQLQCKVGN